MDAPWPRYLNVKGGGVHAQTEDYGDMFSQLQQSKEQQQGLAYSTYRQNLTPESSVEGAFDGALDYQIGKLGQPTDVASLQNRCFGQQQWNGNVVGMQAELTPDSQHDGSFSPDSQASVGARRIATSSSSSAANSMPGVQQWADLDGVFAANIDQAAALRMPQQAFVEDMMMATNQSAVNGQMQGQMNFGDFDFGEAAMSALSRSTSRITSTRDGYGLQRSQENLSLTRDQMEDHSLPYLDSQGAFGQFDDDSFGDGSEHLVIAQPMAVHGNGNGQPRHVKYLSAQAERMGPAGQRAYTSAMTGEVRAAGSSDAGASRAGSAIAQSPSASEGSQDGLAEMMPMRRQFGGGDVTARRPSMTTDLARGMTHVNLQTESPELSSQMRPLFKIPPPPQGGPTLAERRRHPLPNGLNVQRPKALNLGRAISSSAINVLPTSNRFPTSPHATLRRNKSSNVIAGSNGVISGRIQKTGPGSARNSPLVANFPDEINSTPKPQSQATSVTPTSMTHAPQTLQSLMSQQMIEAAQSDGVSVPLSADPTVYTPGLNSAGSMPGGQSWMNTPITTPYGPSQQPAPAKAPWPPASAMPQSAPAHIHSFSRDISPPVMPSMPGTPANMRFPQSQMPMHVMQTAMGPHMYPVVPSQHGLSENPAFIPAQQSFLQMQQAAAAAAAAASWGTQTPWMNFGNDAYGEHAMWLMQNSCLPQKEIEVKLDAGCQRLKDEVSRGDAKLVRIRPQEFSFQNTTTYDMKKALEEKE